MMRDQQEPDGLHAARGDRLVIRGHHLGEPERDAEILEALGPAGGPPFRVRWSDSGHEALIYPGSDAYIHYLVVVPTSAPIESPRLAERDEHATAA